MAKPFYVIALFVTMVTSLVALWNINLSSRKVAFYLSRCSPFAHQKASGGAALVFCHKESGLSWSDHTGGCSEPRLTLLGNCWEPLLQFPLELPRLSEAPTRISLWEKVGEGGCGAGAVAGPEPHMA